MIEFDLEDLEKYTNECKSKGIEYFAHSSDEFQIWLAKQLQNKRDEILKELLGITE
jgi:hypothetical protein